MLLSAILYHAYGDQVVALKTNAAPDEQKQWKRKCDMVWLVVSLFLVVMAIALAAHCNPEAPVLAGVLAALFPEIYLLWYLFTHGILGERCGPASMKVPMATLAKDNS